MRELELLREGEFADTLPQLTEVMRELPQPELLLLGMIFHDVGKGHGDDHSGRGARMMRDDRGPPRAERGRARGVRVPGASITC